MATISLCMIGKNEAHRVVQDLEPHLPYVDEVVFIDDGSTDETPNLVAALPKVKVYSHPCDETDASKLLNQAFSYAQGDYILWKDCDEVFELDALEALQRVTTGFYAKYDGFIFSRKTYINGWLVNLDNLDFPNFDGQLRYFKNHCGLHYVGRLHPTLVDSSGNPLWRDTERVLHLNAYIIHRKTSEEQQFDNERYWDMGQLPAPGWEKVDGVWRNVA